MSDTKPETAETPSDSTQIFEAEIVQSEGVDEAAALGVELPDDKDQAIKLLLDRLGEARDEAGAYLDDLKRVAADFDNFRKRTTREQGQVKDRAAERVVRELLSVLDTFDAALAFEPSTDSERQLLSGMIGTREQLLTALAKEGLEVIETHGAAFDPEVHEPVGAPEGNGELVVGQELRRGYLLNGKLLRAALVSLETKE